MTSAGRMAQIESVIRDWLEEPGLTLFCGDWQNGSIMEIVPETRAQLTRQKYAEPFSGLRDIKLEGQGHHLHLDLAKLGAAVYTVAPCVCYGYRPSFEVRFCDSPQGSPAFSLAVRDPYHGRRVERASIVSYFRRLLDHHARFPDAVRFLVEPTARAAAPPEAWLDILSCFREAGGLSADSLFAPAGPDALGASLKTMLGENLHA